MKLKSGIGLLRDAMVVAGLSMIGVGCWWVYPPAALIVVGTLLLVGGILAKSP